MYTYKIDGVKIEAVDGATRTSLLDNALAIAVTMAFRENKPVLVELNGQPYRLVHVEFVDTITPR